MIRLDDGRYIIGFDDGYQLGKTANFIFDNGVHMLGNAEPTLQENSLFYDGEYFKVGEGRAAITEDKVSDDTARLRTMAGIAMELRKRRALQSRDHTCGGTALFQLWEGQAETDRLL